MSIIHELWLQPGYYTHGATDDDALILEVRGILATRYGWIGRSHDIFDAFYLKCKTIKQVLNQFDLYNEFVENDRRLYYERFNSSK